MSIINYALLRSKLRQSGPALGGAYAGICILGGITNGLYESNNAMINCKKTNYKTDWEEYNRESRSATLMETVSDCSMSFCIGYMKGTIIAVFSPLWAPVFIYDKVCRPKGL